MLTMTCEAAEGVRGIYPGPYLASTRSETSLYFVVRNPMLLTVFTFSFVRAKRLFRTASPTRSEVRGWATHRLHSAHLYLHDHSSTRRDPC